MTKHILVVSAVFLLAGASSFSAAADKKTETWRGYVTDTWCGLHRATEAPTLECTNLCLRNRGAKYALYDVVNNKLYVLSPQEQAARYAAKMVIVTGTLGESAQMVTAQGAIPGATIIASSISVVPPKSK